MWKLYLVAPYTYWIVLCWCLLYAGRMYIFWDSGWILGWIMGCPDWLLHGFPHSLRENIRIVSRLRDDRFLPNSLQFIIYRISYFSKLSLLICWTKSWNKVLKRTVTKHTHTHTHTDRNKKGKENISGIGN